MAILSTDVVSITISSVPTKTTIGSYMVNNTVSQTNSIGAEVTVTYADSSSTITNTISLPRPLIYPTFIGTIRTFGQTTVSGRWS